MNDTLQHIGFEGETRVLSEDELESLMEITRGRISRWPNPVLVLALSSTNPRTFKLPISGRKVACPPDVLIPIVMEEIENRRCVDAEWDEYVFDGQHRYISVSRVTEG
jgi:hypothetical protein